MVVDTSTTRAVSTHGADDLIEVVRTLMLRLTLTLVVVGLAASAIAGVSVGRQGAVGAAVGVGLVLVLFVGSGSLLVATLRRHPELTTVVLAGGALVRLALYGATLIALTRVEGLHRPSLAAATGAAIVIALVQELRALARAPRLFWVDATSGEVDASSEPRS